MTRGDNPNTFNVTQGETVTILIKPIGVGKFVSSPSNLEATRTEPDANTVAYTLQIDASAADGTIDNVPLNFQFPDAVPDGGTPARYELSAAGSAGGGPLSSPDVLQDPIAEGASSQNRVLVFVVGSGDE